MLYYLVVSQHNVLFDEYKRFDFLFFFFLVWYRCFAKGYGIWKPGSGGLFLKLSKIFYFSILYILHRQDIGT
jgi:hypothetical protein